MAENNVIPLSVPVQNVERSRGHLEAMGIIATWSPNGEARIEDMNTACGSIGFAHLAPKPRDYKKALMAALTQKFSKKNRRVAPAGKGYEVLIEHPVANEVRVETTHLLSAWIGVEGEDQYVETDVAAFELDGALHTAEDLAQWVNEAKQKVDGTAIGEALSSIGAALGGIPIRDAGGGFWIPAGSIGRWNALTEALDAAGRPVRMNVWDTANTPRSINSTVESIEAMVDKKCDQIMSAVESGSLGPRALDTKTDEVMTLANQLAEYEATLGQGLETIRIKLMAVQQATVQAALIAQAEKQQAMVDRRLAKQVTSDMYEDQ